MSFYGKLVLLIIVVIEFFELYLEWVNIFYAKKKLEVANLPDFIDRETSEKSVKYNFDKVKISTVESLIQLFILLFLFLSGLIQQFANYVLNLTSNEFLRALIFLGSLQFLNGVVSLPFSLYNQFVIEERYGFNKMTLKLFFRDVVISVSIGAFIGGILLFVVINFIQMFNETWWLIAALFLFMFILLLNYLYPILIAPLFNKFTPIDDEELLNKIRLLSERSGFDISKVYKMDASKRSTHTNAYFTGFGKKKRVVLFDTLLEKFNHDEVVAVLGHELGHYKYRHILKNLILSFAMIILAFYLTYIVIDKSFLYQWFGFEKSLFTGLFLISFLFAPFNFLISPFFLKLSRKFEFQADAYSKKILQSAKFLIDALIKLYKDNLAIAYPHPLYVAFNYSHPPLLERIERLKNEL